MCVVSMIFDHYGDRWRGLQPSPFMPYVPPISPAEIAEFRELLRKAREYDKAHNEPDCELESKKQILRDIADRLGVDISFVDEPDEVSSP